MRVKLKVELSIAGGHPEPRKETLDRAINLVKQRMGKSLVSVIHVARDAGWIRPMSPTEVRRETAGCTMSTVCECAECKKEDRETTRRCFDKTS